jgi:RNA polymerase sigma-70 factor (ECF subfamily)
VNRRARFEKLVSAHGPILFGLMKRFVPEASTAEDLYQDVLLKAWQSLDALDPDRDPLPYLRTLVIHRAIDHLRRQRVRPAPETGRDLDARTHPGARSEGTFEEALAELPPHERAAVLLFYQEGYSVAEVGAALGIPEGTVKTWLYRARARLRERWGEDAPRRRE